MWKLSVATLVLRSKRAETRRAFHSFFIHGLSTHTDHHPPSSSTGSWGGSCGAAVVVPTSLKTFVDVVVEGQWKMTASRLAWIRLMEYVVVLWCYFGDICQVLNYLLMSACTSSRSICGVRTVMEHTFGWVESTHNFGYSSSLDSEWDWITVI